MRTLRILYVLPSAARYELDQKWHMTISMALSQISPLLTSDVQAPAALFPFLCVIASDHIYYLSKPIQYKIPRHEGITFRPFSILNAKSSHQVTFSGVLLDFLSSNVELKINGTRFQVIE